MVCQLKESRSTTERFTLEDQSNDLPQDRQQDGRMGRLR